MNYWINVHNHLTTIISQLLYIIYYVIRSNNHGILLKLKPECNLSVAPCFRYNFSLSINATQYITALSSAFYNGTSSPSLGGIVFYLTVSMNRQCLLHGRAVFLYSRRPLASEIQAEITRARSSNETGTRATDTEKHPSSSLSSTIYMVHPTFIVPPMCHPDTVAVCAGLSNDDWKMGFTRVRLIRAEFANRDTHLPFIGPSTSIDSYFLRQPYRCRRDWHNCFRGVTRSKAAKMVSAIGPPDIHIHILGSRQKSTIFCSEFSERHSELSELITLKKKTPRILYAPLITESNIRNIVSRNFSLNNLKL